MFHRNHSRLEGLELLLVVHLGLLVADVSVLQLHIQPLVVVLESLDLFLVHGFTLGRHLDLHLQLFSILFRLVDLLVQFDDHLCMQVIVSCLQLGALRAAISRTVSGNLLGLFLGHLTFETFVLLHQLVISLDQLLHLVLSFIVVVVGKDCLHGLVQVALPMHGFLVEQGSQLLDLISLNDLVRDLCEA